MTHVRQSIREAVAAVLVGLPTTGARVFQSRLRPLRNPELPCLLVNTDDEEVDTVGVGMTPLQERQLALKVRVVAKECVSLDDVLDSALAEVESALAGQTFGGLAKSIDLGAISIEMSDELEKPAGVATASYQVTYYTAAGSPGSAL